MPRTKRNTRFPGAATCLTAACVILASLPAACLASGFNLDFNDGLLPSAHGFTYVSEGGVPTLPESTAFSVSGGVLHMNTTALPYEGAHDAYYYLKGAYDDGADLFLEFRMRGTDIGQLGFGFLIDDSHSLVMQRYVDLEFWGAYGNPPIAPDSLWLRPYYESIPVALTNWRTYRLTTSASAETYQLSIDSTVVMSGSMPHLSGGETYLRLET